MSRSLKLPDLGEGIYEGEILSIEVSAGDEVEEGDILLEIETDKAAVEVPSPYTGTVNEILVKAGDVVRVGDILVTFSGGEEAEDKETISVKQADERPQEKRENPLPEKKEELDKEHKPVEKSGRKKTGPVPASPSTRRLARDLGVDLNMVTPSGPKGLVTAQDVRSFSEKEGEASPAEKKTAEDSRPIKIPGPELPDFSIWGKIEKITVKPVRRVTAGQMALSWSLIPHVANYDDADLTRLEAFRQKHKAGVEEKNGKLTLTVFALKAVVSALKAHPDFNASLDMDKGEIIRKHYYHVGVAVATDNGLIVPVVRNVDRKSIFDLSVELKDLFARTRDRKVKLDELQGGSFTITNVGPMGGSRFTPVINYPQVAILGMGSAHMQPAVIEKKKGEYDIVPRLTMPFVLCFDHRILDGADAMAFIKTFKQALQDPEEMLMRI